ncbi:ACP S-malonyltransferase [Streptomyces sp. NPDC059070]|uniref:ACP S-malonyltransferase n=1 Tax=Streptomyces sp. NPDC059070 TaxID=3346713 RepID=UPI0036A3B50F
MFPGPGAHSPGSLGPLVSGSAELRGMLERIDRIAAEYGWEPVSDLLLRADEAHAGEVKQRPEHYWLAFYSTSLVLAAMLRSADVAADVLVGHSSGEVAALVAADALTADAGARVLCERIRAVNDTALPTGAMIAVEAAARRVEHMCAAVGDVSLAVAVDNGPRQVVVSGRSYAVHRLQRLAEALMVRATVLEAPGAFHNPMFGGAAHRFAEATAGIEVRAPLGRVYSPQLGRYVRSAGDVRELLAGLLVLPVAFRQALLHLYDDGVTDFVECGAGQLLTGLVAANLPATAQAVPLLSDGAQALSVPDVLARLVGRQQRPRDAVSAVSRAPLTAPRFAVAGEVPPVERDPSDRPAAAPALTELTRPGTV